VARGRPPDRARATRLDRARLPAASRRLGVRVWPETAPGSGRADLREGRSTAPSTRDLTSGSMSGDTTPSSVDSRRPTTASRRRFGWPRIGDTGCRRRRRHRDPRSLAGTTTARRRSTPPTRLTASLAHLDGEFATVVERRSALASVAAVSIGSGVAPQSSAGSAPHRPRRSRARRRSRTSPPRRVPEVRAQSEEADDVRGGDRQKTASTGQPSRDRDANAERPSNVAVAGTAATAMGNRIAQYRSDPRRTRFGCASAVEAGEQGPVPPSPVGDRQNP